MVFNNCYSRVSLNSSSNYDFGGFISGGSYSKKTTSYNNCYYAGEIRTPRTPERTSVFTGGQVGDTVLSNCYYDKTLCTLSFSPSGTGLTTDQMGNKSSYASTWNFKENNSDTDYTWYIDESTGYPELHFN